MGKFKSALNLFVNSYWYVAIFAIVGALSFVFNFFYPFTIVILIWASFGLAYLKNVRTIVPPLFIFPMMGNFALTTNKAELVALFVIVGIFAMSCLYYIFCGFHTTKKFKFGTMFWGFVLALVALLLSGCTCSNYRYIHYLPQWLGYFAVLFVVYVGFTNFAHLNPNQIDGIGKRVEDVPSNKYIKSVSTTSYLMASLLALSVAISFGIVSMFWQSESVASVLGKDILINNRSINAFALVIPFGMISLLYFARNSKFCFLHFLGIGVLFTILLMTYCRATILAAMFVMTIMFVYAFIKSERKKYFLFSFLIFVGILLATFLITYYKLPQIYEYFKNIQLKGNGRKYLYEQSWEFFKKYPVFGIGYYDVAPSWFTWSKWTFHCTPLQLLACSGVVGTLLLSVWFFQKYYVFYRARSEEHMYALGAVVLVALVSLVDVHSFSFEKCLVIVLICALVESAGKAGKPVLKNQISTKPEKRLYRDGIKRVLDFCIALGGIIVFSPIMIVIAIISRIKIGKPVLFAQPRPGKNCKAFVLYKFRSMKDAVDKNGNPLPDDQRITKWGKFLRKSSLDELPQLFNVLKGDMSIVGPRPRMIKDMVFYSSEVMDYYTVRPGITGFDQVNGRNRNSWEKIFELDKEYAEKCSFWLDIKLFFLTFVAIFSGTGSEAGSVTSEREYWYPDYLLKSNKIEDAEYQKGLQLARQIEKVTLGGKHVDVKQECKDNQMKNVQDN